VTRQVIVEIETPEAAVQIKSVLDAAGGGRVKVHLVADAGKGREAVIELPGGFAIHEETPRALRAIRGVGDVREL
jgi:hypothetical protein